MALAGSTLLLAGCQRPAPTSHPEAALEPLAAPEQIVVAPAVSVDIEVSDPDVVELAAASDRSAIAADTPTKVTVRVRLSADALETAERPPFWLVLAVDTSGSMQGSAIEDARGAAVAMLESLRPGDRIAIVTFDSRVEVLVPMTEVTDSGVAALRSEIERMQARGTTDMAGGLQAGLHQLAQAPPDAGRRVVLLSDGVPNEPGPIAALAASARAQRTAVTTIGFGLEYDETLLSELARTSGGSFHRVDHSEALAQAFLDEVFRVQRMVASNVVLTLQSGPGVTIGRVLGHPPVPAGGRTHLVALGDASERQHQDVYVELDVSGHHAGTHVELLDVIVTFEDRAVGAGRLERREFVGLLATDDGDRLAEAHVPTVAYGAARVRAATAILDAIALGRATNFAAARDLLAAAEKDLRATGEVGPERSAQLEEIVSLRAIFAAEAKAQAKAERTTAHGGLGIGAPTAREPLPSHGASAMGIKRSHAGAMDLLQSRPR
jgi:Ca-activated chloride channel homolog